MYDETQKTYCGRMSLLLSHMKMVKKVCKGHDAICMEMSEMYDDFAIFEEDGSWKSWVTSDKYLEVLTLR